MDLFNLSPRGHFFHETPIRRLDTPSGKRIKSKASNMTDYTYTYKYPAEADGWCVRSFFFSELFFFSSALSKFSLLQVPHSPRSSPLYPRLFGGM